MRNAEEFYCTESGEGCGGYFTVMVNLALEGVVTVVCPECKHKHQRRIKNGKLSDDGRWNEKPMEELLGNPATYSKKSRSKKKMTYDNERKSVTLEKAEDRSFVDDRWFEIHGNK